MSEESSPSSEEKCVLTKEDSPAPKRPGGRVTKLSNDLSHILYTTLATTLLAAFFFRFLFLLVWDKCHKV